MVGSKRSGIRDALPEVMSISAAMPVLAGQPAACERAPGNHSHPVAFADREYGRLDAAGEKRVRRLFAAETFQAAPLGGPM